MTARFPAPITLSGSHVRLEPLGRAHVPELFQAVVQDDEVFRWLSLPTPQSATDMAAIVDGYLDDSSCEPFAVISRSTGRAIGVTCFYDANAAYELVEIGGTWYSRSAWRTAVNTESKLLLLTHAFEELGTGRVMWKTDHFNERSQNAIRRLGASYEGTFRRAERRPDNSWRDSVYFSMLADEWPTAKARLTNRLAAGS